MVEETAKHSLLYLKYSKGGIIYRRWGKTASLLLILLVSSVSFSLCINNKGWQCSLCSLIIHRSTLHVLYTIQNHDHEYDPKLFSSPHAGRTPEMFVGHITHKVMTHPDPFSNALTSAILEFISCRISFHLLYCPLLLRVAWQQYFFFSLPPYSFWVSILWFHCIQTKVGIMSVQGTKCFCTQSFWIFHHLAKN